MIQGTRVIALGAAVLLAVTLQASPAHATAPGIAASKPGTVAGAKFLPEVDKDIWLTDQDGLMEHFWVGGSDGSLSIPGNVWHTWENASTGQQSGAVSLNGYFTSGIAGFQNVDGGRLEIFGRAAGGDIDHIWEKAANGATGWSAWASLGGTALAGSGVAAYCYQVDNTARVLIEWTDTSEYYKDRGSNGVWDASWTF